MRPEHRQHVQPILLVRRSKKPLVLSQQREQTEIATERERLLPRSTEDKGDCRYSRSRAVCRYSLKIRALASAGLGEGSCERRVPSFRTRSPLSGCIRPREQLMCKSVTKGARAPV